MTLISYRYKFIYLANKKCASTYVHTILKPFSDEVYMDTIYSKPLGKHDNARKVKKYIMSKGYLWKDFFVFTTIRHPLDRIVSCYFYENNNCNFALVHPLHRVLAIGPDFNFSTATDLAHTTSFPIDWFYPRNSIQIYWYDTDAAL